MSLLDLYFVTNWLPTRITDSGSRSIGLCRHDYFQLGALPGRSRSGACSIDRECPKQRVFIQRRFARLACGWALGVGRVGFIIGPLVGGLLLRLNWETKKVLLSAPGLSS